MSSSSSGVAIPGPKYKIGEVIWFQHPYEYSSPAVGRIYGIQITVGSEAPGANREAKTQFEYALGVRYRTEFGFIRERDIIESRDELVARYEARLQRAEAFLREKECGADKPEGKP